MALRSVYYLTGSLDDPVYLDTISIPIYTISLHPCGVVVNFVRYAAGGLGKTLVIIIVE